MELYMINLLNYEYFSSELLKYNQNLAIRNFLVAIKLFLNAKCEWQIGTGNGSLIPICCLSNSSLFPSLTVLSSVPQKFSVWLDSDLLQLSCTAAT